MLISKRKDNFQESGKLASGSSARTAEITVEVALLRPLEWDNEVCSVHPQAN